MIETLWITIAALLGIGVGSTFGFVMAAKIVAGELASALDEQRGAKPRT